MNTYSNEIIDYVINLLKIISNNYEITTYIVEEDDKNILDDEIDGENIFNCVNQSQFLIDLMNNYVKYYKLIKKKKFKFNLFDEIDIDNPSSTNHILEEFYEKMIEYKTFPEKNKLYKYTDKVHINDEHYGLLVDGILLYKSCSLFTLLIEQTNIQYEKKTRNINIILLN